MTLVQVRGYFEVPDGESAVEGSVYFELSSPLLYPSGDVAYPATRIVCPLVNGHFTTHLVCNDDDLLMPKNTYYTVTENIAGAARRRYDIVVHKASAAGGINLADITPVVGGPPVYDYAPQAGLLEMNVRLTRVEGATSGGRVPHRFYGDGPPDIVIGAAPGDEYVDRITMMLYVLNPD